MRLIPFTFILLFFLTQSFAQNNFFPEDFAMDKEDTLVLDVVTPDSTFGFIGLEFHLNIAPNALEFIGLESYVLDEKDIEHHYEMGTSPFTFNVNGWTPDTEPVQIPSGVDKIARFMFVALDDIPSANAYISTSEGDRNEYILDDGNGDVTQDLVFSAAVNAKGGGVNITYISKDEAEFMSAKRQRLQFTISDILGRQIYREVKEVDAGPVLFTMPTDLPQNQHLVLSVSNGSEIFAKKFYSSAR